MPLICVRYAAPHNLLMCPVLVFLQAFGMEMYRHVMYAVH
jgi:hypothetical protein